MKTVEGLRYKRTLFVGLGGAGAKTLRSLKHKIINANKGKLPEQVKFLLIDTNATELANLRDFDSNEKVCIAVREPYQRYKHDKDADTHAFIPKANAHSLLALERGAGQIRSNGHFAVIENQYSKKLTRVFRACADKLEDIDVEGETLERDPKIEVRLVFSIAGGTGSGTFLPISVLIRDAIKNCELTAYIYSATHFEKKVENSAKYSVMQNAYAALCELDYMMHFGREDKRYEPLEFNFGPEINQKITQTNRPFEEVYYIDKRTSLPVSESIEMAYNELDRLQDNTADAMFLAATNIITAHTGTVDNVRQKILEGQFDVSDKFAWVSGLGIAEIFLNTASQDNPEVIKECCNTLKARIGDGTSLDDSVIDEIATSFIRRYKWDESGGPHDGDPILKRIFDNTNNRIKDICTNLIKWSGDDKLLYSSEPINLDVVLAKATEDDANTKIKKCTDFFEEEIQKLIVSLINDDKYTKETNGIILSPFVKDFNGKGNGMSLQSVQMILARIEHYLGKSITKLGGEESEYSTEKDSAGEEEKKIRKDREDGAAAVSEQELKTYNADTYALIREQKIKALCLKILEERTQRAIEVFTKCQVIIQRKKELLAKLNDILVKAHKSGSKRNVNTPGKDKNSLTNCKSNCVEVRALEVAEGFRLKYEYMEEFYKLWDEDKTQSDESLFNEVCSKFIESTGSLQKFLVNGIEQINKLAKDEHIKVERTECQKKIERLIDLSTPTMQVDRHGYGDQVKVDQFWYIMTNCPESNIIDNTNAKGTDLEKKSVGALLKDLIEQNTLEDKVNLVHVPGWHNKAILFRVKSAVPVYFVDGVCDSGVGSYTLEGCYEELKMTKRTYTPFSHETLRQKLENRVSALKPMDVVADAKILNYWVNFLMLGYIQVRDNTYCIDSKACGERITDNLLCRNNVLVLGDTRADAYETFQRFCGALLKEKKEAYEKSTNNFDRKGVTININEINACDYVEDFDLCQYSMDGMKELERNDPDFILLDREIKHIEKRYENYKNMMDKKTHEEKVANCDSNSWNTFCSK